MREINIANTILSKRKEKGLTQDEFASYLGVSKAAISKWETAQSYPDITLLPVIASYFDISIDTLIGYSPQLCKEDIVSLYHKYCEEFAKYEVMEVIKHIRIQVKKYHSCYEWLYYASLLYVNHAPLAKTKGIGMSVYDEAVLLTQRVQKECGVLQLQKLAQSLEQYCYLVMNKPKEILMKSSDIEEIHSNFLLANAFLMDGQTKKALQCVQVDMYQALMILCNAYPLLNALQMQEESTFSKGMDTMLQLIQIFHVDELNVGVVLPMYLSGMEGYTMQGKHKEAMQLLEAYCEILENVDSFMPKYGEQFSQVAQWSTDFILSIDTPRSKKVVMESAMQVFAHPAFEALQGIPRFQELHEKLKKVIERM